MTKQCSLLKTESTSRTLMQFRGFSGYLLDRVLLCSPDCAGTHYVNHAGFQPTEIHLPPEWSGLRACTMSHGCFSDYLSRRTRLALQGHSEISVGTVAPFLCHPVSPGHISPGCEVGARQVAWALSTERRPRREMCVLLALLHLCLPC